MGAGCGGRDLFESGRARVGLKVGRSRRQGQMRRLGGLGSARAADPRGENGRVPARPGRGGGKVSPIECDLRHTLGRPLTVV